MNSKNKSIHSIIAATGVVFGDIGTSPLYAFKICFLMGGLIANSSNVLGVTSLLIWVITLMVTIKYVYIVMRFDHHGDGGILVLANFFSKIHSKFHIKKLALILGVSGAALFVSDGVITPAISVLSALEGLTLISTNLTKLVLPCTIVVLSVLFLIQGRGSSKLGIFFGPIILLWFITLAILGGNSVWHTPVILQAINPYYAIQLFWQNSAAALAILGGTILVITGAEALYADIGHFGKTPIRQAWLCIAFPALVLHYLGQGALVLRQPEAIANPFYYLVPKEYIHILIIFATAVSFIAAQAVISGVFSVARQAIMLNYLPRMEIKHTSAYHIGQVFVPSINLFLLFFALLAVLFFQRSENLATAYGLSVAGVMVITSFMTASIAYSQFNWSLWKLLSLFLPMLLLDIVFFIGNLGKLHEGAWYTVVISAIIILVIYCWMSGNKIIHCYKQYTRHNLQEFIHNYRKQHSQRIPGTAVFMSRDPKKAPQSMLANLRHNKLLHEKIICISIITTETPKVESHQRFEYQEIAPTTYSITANYGFKEMPDLNRILAWAQEVGIITHDEEVLFFLSKTVAVPSKNRSLNGIFEAIYIYLSKNTFSAYEFYKIPKDKVLELGIWYKV